MTKNVLIFGSNGALGRAVSQRFAAAGWFRVLIDVTRNQIEPKISVGLSGIARLEDQFAAIENKLKELGVSSKQVDAVINVGGGFRMDDASVCTMIDFDSVYS
jgi:NAD(P)-dependent dehydrogenase (short-subunit alcohol dehydrogenase family)